MSLPTQRKRVPTDILASGMSRIFQGVFGGASKVQPNTSAPENVIGDTRREAGFYHMHEGDIFNPGTGNWVLDPFQETALNTIWGHGFLRKPNTFNPVQPPQVYSSPTVTTRGIGGLVAGQIAFQPMIEPGPEQGS